MTQKYWLIYYSQRSGSHTATANEVSKESPVQFLNRYMTEYPEADTKIMWAIEISEEDFNLLDGEL